MTEIFNRLWHRLEKPYGEGEAKAIVRLLLEVRFDLTWTDIICGKTGELPREELTVLELMMRRLEQGEPVQYVLGQAEFGPYNLHVAPGVLIPRPETYELCQWIVDTRTRGDSVAILDIGTGSGCIACTLAKELPGAEVTAWDISDTALAIARENAARLGVSVAFAQMDALKGNGGNAAAARKATSTSGGAKKWDIIVSNPPYICRKEASTMDRNVVDHEPDIALFVTDDDPLLFYRAIADFGRKQLEDDGWLYFEINPLYDSELQKLLDDMSYHDVETKEDQYGKQRMIRAQR